jgi:prepilin-type N-terminal cleavage/methylation domain-containing protein
MDCRLALRPPARRARSSRGFTVLELLVVLAVMTAALGLLLPAASTAREAARRLQCRQNLHQLGIALFSYHDTYSGLPPGWQVDATKHSAYGWASCLLPWLDEANLQRQIDFRAPVDAAQNAFARKRSLPVLRCPSDIAPQTFLLFADSDPSTQTISLVLPDAAALAQLPSANYVGIFGNEDADEVPGDSGTGAFLATRSIRLAEFTRGLSHSLLVGERTARKLPSTWLGIVFPGEDAYGRIVGFTWIGPSRSDTDECEFDSRHPQCANFLWGDGRVDSIGSSIDAASYRAWARRASDPN